MGAQRNTDRRRGGRGSDQQADRRVAFRISAELRERCEAAIAAVREADDPRQHVDELVEVVIAMTEAGLDYFFLYPLAKIEAGAIAQGTAKVGVAAARRGLPTVVRRVVATLSDEQLLELVDFIDDLLVP